MHKQENNVSLANTLDDVSQVTVASSIRGNDRIVIRDPGCKYSSVGNQVRRNCVGVTSIHQALKLAELVQHCHILLYFQQIEHLLDVHIDIPQV